MITATYSPEDNKIRLYSTERLDPATYERVKAEGFKWAPKQDLFVAPMWTPSRESLALELAGEIVDEDTTLVDRAESKADRLEDLSERKLEQATAAYDRVESIAGNIPLGQPILVGHHSEKHARRDAEKIENGMRKAVSCWRSAQYWKDRAAGAIRNAKYKELPAVRARRIKGLEADLRKEEKQVAICAELDRMWGFLDTPDKIKHKDGSKATPLEWALFITNREHASRKFPLAEYPRELPASQYEGDMSVWSALNDGIISHEQARKICQEHHARSVNTCNLWIAHIKNRLEYERAMLAESGGTVADRVKPEKGGACRCWASPGYGAGWSYIVKVNKVSVSILEHMDYSPTGVQGEGRNLSRTMPLDKIKAIMTAAQVQEAREAGRIIESQGRVGFYLSGEHEDRPCREQPTEPEAEKFSAIEDSLRAGIKTVSAPTLFVTPPDIARKMVDAVGGMAGCRVLEPSAGTGNLVVASCNSATGFDCFRLVAVEINHTLSEGLREMRRKYVYANEDNFDIRCADFLQCNGDLGQFDRIVMNPPFDHGSDIAHIKHAMGFLKPEGRLVALCANGPRQRAELMPIADTWEDLPQGSFKDAGTGVNVAMLTIEKTTGEYNVNPSN